MQRQNFISTLILLICGIAFVCSPAYARFLQTDPVGYGDDIDWYTYVQNDPTDKTDPTGRDSMICQHKDKNGDFSDCKVFRDRFGFNKSLFGRENYSSGWYRVLFSAIPRLCEPTI